MLMLGDGEGSSTRKETRHEKQQAQKLSGTVVGVAPKSTCKKSNKYVVPKYWMQRVWDSSAFSGKSVRQHAGINGLLLLTLEMHLSSK